MIDTEHLDMDTIDNESDTMQRLYDEGDMCALCGEPAMPNSMCCKSCMDKWLDEGYYEWKKSRDLE
jgi:hypothetical protein